MFYEIWTKERLGGERRPRWDTATSTIFISAVFRSRLAHWVQQHFITAAWLSWIFWDMLLSEIHFSIWYQTQMRYNYTRHVNANNKAPCPLKPPWCLRYIPWFWNGNAKSGVGRWKAAKAESQLHPGLFLLLLLFFRDIFFLHPANHSKNQLEY